MDKGFFEQDETLDKQVFDESTLNKKGKIVPVDADVLDEVASRRGKLSQKVLATPLPETEDITHRQNHEGVWTPAKVKKSRKLDEGQKRVLAATLSIVSILVVIGFIGWTVYYVLTSYLA